MQITADEEDCKGIDGFADEETPLPDAAFEADDVRRRLEACLNRLPVHYRAVLTLYYFEQKSYEEIAMVLDQPMNTIKVHLFRAKSHLRKALLAERSSEEWTA